MTRGPAFGAISLDGGSDSESDSDYSDDTDSDSYLATTLAVGRVR